MNPLDPGAAILRSVEVGGACAILGLPLAIGFGYLLARRDFRGKSLLSAALLAPMVLPPVVTGLLLLAAFGRRAPVGGWLAAHGLPLSFSFAAAVLAALVVGLPLHIMAARLAFEAVDPRFEEVSLSLGVPPLRTFVRVTLPLALPGLAGGAVLAFARGLGEFGATIVLAADIPAETRTIPLAVYALLDQPGADEAVRSLVGASLLVSLAALWGYEALSRWQRRRLEIHRGR